MVISRESFKDSDGDKMMIIMYNGDHIQSFIILRETEREREIERERERDYRGLYQAEQSSCLRCLKVTEIRDGVCNLSPTSERENTRTHLVVNIFIIQRVYRINSCY